MTAGPDRPRPHAALLETVRRVAGGTPTFAVVMGEPGTGRSTLLRWAADRAGECGVRVLATRAVEGRHDRPLSTTARLIAACGRRPGEPLPPTASGRIDHAALHRNCRTVLESARRRPLLLVVDDLQWADPLSQEWLQMLLRRRHHASFGVLVSDTGTHEGSSWVRAPGPPEDTVVRTARLTLAEVRDTVADRLGHVPDRATAVRLRRATGGVPAVLSRVLDRWDGDGDPARLARVVDGARQGHANEVVDGLPDDLRDTLTGIAVCGRPLAALAGRIGQGTGHGGDLGPRLAATGLLAGTHPPVLDPVAADVVLSRVPLAERRALFTRAARAARRAALAESDIARVLLAAPVQGEPWVAGLLHRGARELLAAGRHAEAAAVAERAFDETVPAALRGPLTTTLAAARAHHDPAAARRLLSRLAASARDPEPHDDAAPGCRDAPRPRTTGSAIDLLLAEGDTGSARRALAGAAAHCRPSATQVRQLGFDGAGDDHGPPPEGTGGTGAYSLLLLGRDRRRALALAREAAAVVGGPDADRPIVPRVTAAMTLQASGHHDEARAGMRRLVLDLAGAGRVPTLVLGVSALIELRAGAREGARRDLRAARRGPAAVRKPGCDPLLDAVEALLHVVDGDLSTATSVALAGSTSDTDRAGVALLTYVRGIVHMLSGSSQDAVDDLMACGRLLLDRGRVNPAIAPWRSTAARLLAGLGSHATARRLALEEHRLALRWGAPAPIALVTATLRELPP